MSKSDLRKTVHKYVDQADERTLEMVLDLVESEYSSKKAYHLDGSQIGQNELLKRANTSEEDIIAKRTQSAKALQKEIKSW
ncbi:MAG: hypothetical protein R8N23_01900 [Reichenbachiella sp.]|uniref:hypothetical protein n=1 Tax=Reichenbachiella sp. TaxID=2184521 RepID=UPI0029665568|nr:hypothetical protein [Reichenbachiella sp.]MDW3208593.1 hypothetical protein [Reichenbachiella sp.]